MTPAAWAASNAEAIWVGRGTAGGGAFDETHLQIHLPVDFAVVVDRHDVRFLQSAGDAGLTLHPLAKYGVLAEFGGHQLDGNGPLFDGVLGLVDLAHPPAAQPLL